MALLAASSFYLYRTYTRVVAPPPPIVETVAPPVKTASFLSTEEIRKVRASARSPDPGVRWTSMELLYTLGDPDSLPLLEKAVAEDPETELRLKAIKLLSSRATMASLQGLVRGLGAFDKTVRVASLQGLVDLGEPAAIPWIAETAQKDYEPEVRAEALRALSRFQDKRKEQFAALAAQLQSQYEAAVEKLKKSSP